MKKKHVLIVLLLLLACINVMYGVQGMLIHNAAFPDDFIMRYRESKYVLYHINPFEVVLGYREPLDEIGPLWDVAGYTPWGMVLGIVLNFTFLPEATARMVFLCVYMMFLVAALWSVDYVVVKMGCKKERLLILCFAAAFPAWGTALSWLNFGAIMGILIFWSVLLIDDHEILAGVLLGLAATKPQLALPFYLAVLLKRKYRTFVVACVVPAVLWGICAWMVQTSPIELILQLSQVTSALASDLGSWMARFGIRISNIIYRGGCALGSIGFSGFLWYRMKKTWNHNNLCFFAVPAVMSGIWTYSQDHDRTVLLIFMLLLYGILLNEQAQVNRKSVYVIAFLIVLVINPDVIALIMTRGDAGLERILAAGFTIIRYLGLVIGLWWCVETEGEWQERTSAASQGMGG